LKLVLDSGVAGKSGGRPPSWPRADQSCAHTCQSGLQPWYVERV